MYFEDIYGMIFDLNECLCNININIDPYVLIEIVLLKYVNSGNNSRGILGNNSSGSLDISFESKNNLKGVTKSDNIEVKKASLEDTGNTKISDISAKKEVSTELKKEVKGNRVIHKKKNNINLNIRINNCFVECTKDIKVTVSKSWVDFMNYLMTKDRSLISLLADTSILAASNTYVLIQSKIGSTNELINDVIGDLEKYYEDFAGNKVRFAALSEDLWKKEMENYRINIKNGIKYSYMSEPEIENSVSDNVITSLNGDDIEEIAKAVFGSFEVE
jgi:hypothetical protein